MEYKGINHAIVGLMLVLLSMYFTVAASPGRTMEDDNLFLRLGKNTHIEP